MLPALSAEAGKGLGSRLLGSLRDCDAILFVVRAGGGHDPEPELRALEEELILADLGSVEARLDKQRRAAKGDASLAAEVGALERAEAALSDGVPLYRSDVGADDRARLEPVEEHQAERTPEVEALVRSVLGTFQKMVELAPYLPDQLLAAAINISSPENLADFVAGSVNVSLDERQQALETLDVAERLRLVRTSVRIPPAQTPKKTPALQLHAWRAETLTTW